MKLNRSKLLDIVYQHYELEGRTVEQVYKDFCKWVLLEHENDYNELNNYENFKRLIKEEDFIEIMRKKQNRKNKRNRCDKKIKDMLRIEMLFYKDRIDTKVVFGTLTLNDRELSKKEDTYIRKISKYLRKHYEYVILNKDYGEKTEREHYHFIGLTKEKLVNSGKKSKKGISLYNLEKQDYSLGFEPDLEIINLEDKKKIRNYLLKLNNHSNKVGTSSRIRILVNPIIKPILQDIQKLHV